MSAGPDRVRDGDDAVLWGSDRFWRTGLVFVLAYLVLALLTLEWHWILRGLDLSRLIWLPSGLALAYIVREGPRGWPWIFVGEALVTAFTGNPLVAALGTGAGSTAEALLAAWLFRRLGFSPTLKDWRDVVMLIALGAGVSSLLGAFVSVSSIVVSGGLRTGNLFPVSLRWWLTHANGILLLTPVLLTFRSGLVRRVRERPGEASALAGLIVLAGGLLFGTPVNRPFAGLLLYLPLPLLLWMAFRFRLGGAAWANLFLLMPALIGTAAELGPLAGGGPSEQVMSLTAFMAVCILTSLVLAGVVADREEEAAARIAAEAERRKMSEQVHQAQKLESLGVLAGGIAHDFNNLLATIMGNADLADRKLGEEEPAADHVAEVLRASRRAADLCRQILAYAGRGQVSAAAVDLREVVQEMGELLSVSFPKDAEVEFLESGEVLPVWGDVSQLRQVVLNLLTNAADALPGGRGRVTVSTGMLDAREVRVQDIVAGDAPRPGASLVCLTVADDGPGMDEEVRARVFEPFFSTKDAGRGLGLSVVSGIVRSHGGCLELRTAPGEGARFRMTLPVTHRAVTSTRLTPPLLDDVRFQGKVVLADDEEAVRTMASIMLAELGLEVITAPDGYEAVAAFEGHRDDVVAVLLDVTMPRMNGYQALRAIRGLDPTVPIILSSGNLEDADAVEQEWGTPLLAKPYAARELSEVLARILVPKPVAPLG